MKIPKPVVLIILDGWGYRAERENNAIALADTPNYDALLKEYPSTLVHTSGRRVGLPNGLMGNSEVGHLNIGAGRVVYQEITRIDASIESGEFFQKPELLQLMEAGRKTRLHFMGLLPDGADPATTCQVLLAAGLLTRGRGNGLHVRRSRGSYPGQRAQRVLYRGAGRARSRLQRRLLLPAAQPRPSDSGPYAEAGSVHDVDRARHRGVQRAVVVEGVRCARGHGKDHIAVGRTIACDTVRVRVARSSSLHRLDVERVPGGVHRKGVGASSAQRERGIGDAIHHVSGHSTVGDHDGPRRMARASAAAASGGHHAPRSA